MKDNVCIILIILIIWLILYILLEFNIINKRNYDVMKIFIGIDKLFQKRMDILSQLLDIVKAYDRNQFDEFGSKLYDYVINYKYYDINEKIRINEFMENDINKILLVSKVYPELKDVYKFVKLEKQIIRYSKVIKKMKLKYNRVLDEYNCRKKIFPSGLICDLLKFYNYNYFDV